MTDKFFTPKSVARRLVSFLRREPDTYIADFAAGDGELLRAATEKWPSAQCVATDIDHACVAKLSREHPNWEVGRCDFLNYRSRVASPLLRGKVGEMSLILLNPPFSCRGNRTIAVDAPEHKIQCSISMAFMLNAVHYLNSTGRLVAILPASSPTSQKDSSAWAYLAKKFSVRTVADFGLRTFPTCAARTIIVRLQRKTISHERPVGDTALSRSLAIKSTIVRGAVPMHAARNGLAGSVFPLVHTTDLQGEQIYATEHSLRNLNRYAVGPSVLIPRVGRPSPNKCVLYLARKRLVLSDCVYAIRCQTSDDARQLHGAIHACWDDFAQLYSGTCAPYLTVASLHSALTQLGVTITNVEAVGFKVQDG